MNTAAPWRAGVATDTGLQRSNNEDRVHVDEAAGVFMVVDGVGGHAAGERAAEIAVKTISEKLATLGGDAEERIRRAITAANNEIYELAQGDEDCRGMACVLTLALAHDDRVTVGHVGDSRLYLVWNGVLRKLTADHSPVGELEDVGRLTEDEAMRHPRRNEVFRDIGSRLRDPHEEEFIEIKTVRFRPDAALLLCSDGLSDVLTSAQIGAILEGYDGDPGLAARKLVDAANQAGGKDNVSAVFVAGPEYRGSSLLEFQPRHAITRKRRRGWWRGILGRTAWLLLGMLLGMTLWASLERMFPRPTPCPSRGQAIRRKFLPAAESVGPPLWRRACLWQAFCGFNLSTGEKARWKRACRQDAGPTLMSQGRTRLLDPSDAATPEHRLRLYDTAAI